MGASLNQCNFIGHVGKNPDMSYTSAGLPVTKFSLAVDQGKGKDPMWLNITCFGKLGEVTNQYVKKGKLVYVTGKLALRKYTDRGGVERTAVDINADSVVFLDGGGENRSSSRVERDGLSTNYDDLGELDDHPF